LPPQEARWVATAPTPESGREHLLHLEQFAAAGGDQDFVACKKRKNWGLSAACSGSCLLANWQKASQPHMHLAIDGTHDGSER